MVRNKSSAARAGSFARTQSISAKLAKPNVWAEWLPEKELGPISWAHLAALLLRRLPPERAIEALAPVLDDTRQAVERAFETDIHNDPGAEEGMLPYAGYREAYLESCERDVSTALSKLDGSEDVAGSPSRLLTARPINQSCYGFCLVGLPTPFAMASSTNQESANNLPGFATLRGCGPKIIHRSNVSSKRSSTLSSSVIPVMSRSGLKFTGNSSI